MESVVVWGQCHLLILGLNQVGPNVEQWTLRLENGVNGHYNIQQLLQVSAWSHNNGFQFYRLYKANL